MGKLNLNTNQLARIKSFASRGNDESAMISAIFDGTIIVEFTAGAEGAEAADTIRVTGQLKDWDGSDIAAATGVLLEGLQTAGDTLTISVVTGTAKAGDGTTKVWLETDANGTFVVDVLLQNAGGTQAGDVLLNALTDDGQVENLQLTFA